MDRRVDEDKRSATRYQVVVPVQLQNGSTGRTRNMSTSGIFFETEQEYSLGEIIQLSVVLNGSTVQCGGRVIRVERLEREFGIAVELIFYEFC